MFHCEDMKKKQVENYDLFKYHLEMRHFIVFKRKLKQLRDITESFIILLLHLYMMSKLLICINKTQFHLPVFTGKIFFHKMCKDFNMLLTRNFF